MNIGTYRQSNFTMVSIRHNQKLQKEFYDFDQNATVIRLNSIWSFHNNSTLVGTVKKT